MQGAGALAEKRRSTDAVAAASMGGNNDHDPLVCSVLNLSDSLYLPPLPHWFL